MLKHMLEVYTPRLASSFSLIPQTYTSTRRHIMVFLALPITHTLNLTPYDRYYHQHVVVKKVVGLRLECRHSDP